MCRRMSLTTILTTILLGSVTWAVPIQVENFSFELPGTGKRMGFSTIPGWSTDSASSGSGVETAGATDGDYSAFLMGSDPFIWQLTNHTIFRGDIIELRVDTGDTGVFISLYYDDNGTRITVASNAEGNSLVFDSAEVPDSVNHLLGIELGNTEERPGEWVNVDNIRLDLIKAGKSELAYQPSPASEQSEVLFDTILNWTPGEFSQTQNVYLSTNFDEVKDGTALVGNNQVINSYNPGKLDFGATYYWRVDGIGAAPNFTVYTGPVWSFMVEPLARPIGANDIAVTASSQLVNQGPEKTIDRSGLDVNDLHSNNSLDAWLSDVSEPNSAWIQYQFDKPHRMYQMLVWNFNVSGLSTFAGCKDVSIQYSLDGINWPQVDSVSEFAMATGISGYAPGTIIDLNGIRAQYIHIDIINNWSGGFINQYGLSEVQFQSIPLSSRQPNPASGGTDVAVDATLSWLAGREAVDHRVYFSSDEQAVKEGTALVETVQKPAYRPADSLDLNTNTTYYWRVDEVNEAEIPATWEGSVWNFTTKPYISIDDFESYTEVLGDRVYQTWIDGYGWNDGAGNGVEGNGTGAAVGYLNPPTMETDIQYDGNQSMPLGYGAQNKSLSEATVTFAEPQPLNKHGIKTLSLQFYGSEDNVPGQLFIKINGTKVSDYPGPQSDMQQLEWHAWTIDLSTAGITSMQTLTIGVTGGNGTVLIDAIRLYPAADQD